MGTPIFGSSVLRAEDPRFLRGEARYVEDLPAEGALHAVFVRSWAAHGRLRGVDSSGAPAGGAVAVLAAADLRLPPQPPSGNAPDAFARPPLAEGVVRFAGEAVAVVLAESREAAIDAAETVTLDIDPLPAVVGPEAAVAKGAPALFPRHGHNVCVEFGDAEAADPLEGAQVVVRGRFVNQRVAPVPMETNACLAAPGAGRERLTIWVSTQIPFDVRADLAEALGLVREDVRVVAPDVGGGFGAKLTVYPEYLVVAAAALRLGRPVRWIETRSESMVALTHGRAQVQEVEAGALRDGAVVGMRVRLLADAGAYPLGAFLAPITRQMLSGAYRIPRIECRGEVVVTNATPIGPYRGAGRPEAAALVERTMDLVAAELELDPGDVRRRNLIPTDAFPFETASGSIYDVGDYERALDEALRVAGYERLRDEQRARRDRGDRRQLGIGIATYVEITAFGGSEFGSVDVGRDGTVTVLSGLSPHGQGHETALAQLVSGILRVPGRSIRVVHSDTGVVPAGDGTYASRSLQLGGSAVWRAAEAVAGKARRLAAHLLEVADVDVAIATDGRVGVIGAPDVSLTWSELATAADDAARLPPDMQPGLRAEERFRQASGTFPFGAHVSVVEVDVETGDVRPLRHVAVDDCGRILNPMLVRGQVHGGIAQGLGQALYEGVAFDGMGNPLTATLATYAVPSAAELPSFETAHTETPTPLNPLGAKGIGESATIGSTPAAQGAVVDALAHLGVRHVDMPASPERVWSAIRDAARAGEGHGRAVR